ncbi:hypothetical protein ACH35V_30635 [Actinomadura sp. 1N219]|uniref:hypothetical protein n=1 Tax=Actinomadura sp. 1N219 TaxID=3375152 RepID=UPI0037A9C3C0
MAIELGPILFWLLLYGAACAMFGVGVAWLIWPWIHRRGIHRKGAATRASASRTRPSRHSAASTGRRYSPPPGRRTGYTG